MQYVGHNNIENSQSFESSNTVGDSKRRKICTDDTGRKCADGAEINSIEEDSAGNFSMRKQEILIFSHYLLRKWILKFHSCNVYVLMVGGVLKNECHSCVKTDTNAQTDFDMSLVKLTRNGLLLLTFPREHSPNTVNIVSKVFQYLDSGSLKSPV